MASHFFISTSFTTSFTKFQYVYKFIPLRSPSGNASSKLIQPVSCTAIIDQQQIATRRSGNYPPSLWDDHYIQSLTSVYTEETYKRRAEKLKNDVRLMMQGVIEPLDQLELIDDLNRLGISYLFEDTIQTMLMNICVKFKVGHTWKEYDLHAISLHFRLLRDHGFHVSLDVFENFKDASGDFKSSLSTDTKGLLSLYEASYLSIEGETTMDNARDFSTRHLVRNLNHEEMDQILATKVGKALEVPLHWRMLRNQSRWFIQLYQERKDMNPILLELAKLDFNLVQSIHQNDLKIMSRWWKQTGLGEKLPFVRDRSMENFIWTVGILFEPRQRYGRQILAKTNALITTIDDVYDVYGTLDELVLFTDAVEKWDINMIDQLPDYMKICFLALFNFANKMAYDVLKEHGYNVISHLKRVWTGLCKAYLLEAKWYHSGYKPTLEEYLNNAWLSIAVPVMLSHVYLCTVTEPITKEALDCFLTSPIIHGAAMVLRLTDDLGTSSDEMERGDVPKSIQCYMNDTGATEEEARDHVRSLIGATWRTLNEERFKENCPYSKTLIAAALNLARMSQFMYQHGDGHGGSRDFTKDRVLRLIVEPICFN